MRPDLRVARYGGMLRIDADSRAGWAWLRGRVHAEGLRSGLERGCDCDARAGHDITMAALAEGLSVLDMNSGIVAQARPAK